MQKKGANISLKGYDDIFSTDQSRAEAQQERVQEIPLSELHPFEGHPFRVVDDEEMMKTAESVRDFGVLTPAIVRPDPDGGYEIVSGHRRHRASELAGKETMPAIVRDLDDDAAIILMVDANLQRESILPSERAFAYKMKLDAIKHQGQRTDLTSSQVGMKLQAMDIVGQEAGESRNQVHRYIRLTELIPELLDMVDTGQIKFNPAVELSYLASEEQKDFLSAMDYIRLGKWGRMRKEYLRLANPVLFSDMVLNETLYEHCAEIEETAKKRMEIIVPQLAKAYGVTEQLKAENQIEWVRQMNACVAQAEEAIKGELIYC